MNRGLSEPTCVDMTQPAGLDRPGEVRPVGGPEDIPVRARPSETGEARLWRRLKAFDTTIKTASKMTLKPRKNPDPHRVKWWNDECTAACTLVYHAPNGAARQQAFWELCHTIKRAKRTWGHEVLNGANGAAYIWHMAKVRKGRINNIFPALRQDDQ
jgi:hypothetical protein